MANPHRCFVDVDRGTPDHMLSGGVLCDSGQVRLRFRPARNCIHHGVFSPKLPDLDGRQFVAVRANDVSGTRQARIERMDGAKNLQRLLGVDHRGGPLRTSSTLIVSGISQFRSA